MDSRKKEIIYKKKDLKHIQFVVEIVFLYFNRNLGIRQLISELDTSYRNLLTYADPKLKTFYEIRAMLESIEKSIEEGKASMKDWLNYIKSIEKHTDKICFEIVKEYTPILLRMR